jgi:hypothetical protein
VETLVLVVGLMLAAVLLVSSVWVTGCGCHGLR